MVHIIYSFKEFFDWSAWFYSFKFDFFIYLISLCIAGVGFPTILDFMVGVEFGFKIGLRICVGLKIVN